jgi:hypothetical protein
MDGDDEDAERRVITVSSHAVGWSDRWSGLVAALAPWRADR